MTSVSTNKILGTISFTFDDGISKNMKTLLDILAKEDIKATFFLIGNTLGNNKSMELAKEAAKQGHILANHTWTHPQITKISDEEFIKELDRAEETLIKIRGDEGPKFFRPPYGAINKANNAILTARGYTSFLWNIDMQDWNLKRSKQDMLTDYERLFAKADPARSSFISLQHDRRLDSVELVPTIARLARDRGFKIVQLEKPLVSVV